MPDRPADPHPGCQPAEIVFLLTEVQAGDTIYEIGSRASVLRAGPDELTLALGGPEPAVVTCPPSYVRSARVHAAPASAARARHVLRPFPTPA